MKSRFFTIVTPVLMLFGFLLGITPPAFSSIPLDYNSAELTSRLKSGIYLQKTDNLMIIVDGLGETFLGVGEPRNQKIARQLVSNIGKTIPNIPHSRMLRVYGSKVESFEKDFSTVFGLYHINVKGFTPIIATKTHASSDFDPLGLTFISATKDLSKLSGSHAVILISDGVNIPQSAIYESAFMKKKFGGSICYYPIFIGNDPQGAKNMSTIAKIGDCGFLAQYQAVDSPVELTDYLEKVFFSKRRMPVEPQPVAVDQPPLPVEEPLEPVVDDVEEVMEIVEEPFIPEIIEEPFEEEVIILERQLPHDKVVTIELYVEFDLDKATIRPGYEEEIGGVAEFMLLYPETEALLEGHTCDLGSDAYNLALSSRRAETVKKYLVTNFGIHPDRIKTLGVGEREPIADNSTEAGRMKNRRVMAVISTIVTDYVTVEQEVLKSDFLRDDFVLPPVDQLVDEMMQQVDEEEYHEEAEEEEATPAGQEEMTEPAVDVSGAELESEVTTVPAGLEDTSVADQVAAPVTDAPPIEEEEEPATPDLGDSDDNLIPADEMADAAVDAAFEVKEEDVEGDVVSEEGSLLQEDAEPAEEGKDDSSAEPVSSSQAAQGDALVVVAPAESAFDDTREPLTVDDMLKDTVEDVEEKKHPKAPVSAEDPYL